MSNKAREALRLIVDHARETGRVPEDSLGIRRAVEALAEPDVVDQMRAALAQAFEALPNGPARMAVASALLAAEPAHVFNAPTASGGQRVVAIVTECHP